MKNFSENMWMSEGQEFGSGDKNHGVENGEEFFFGNTQVSESDSAEKTFSCIGSVDFPHIHKTNNAWV